MIKQAKQNIQNNNHNINVANSDYSIHYYNQTVDHFQFNDPRTFKNEGPVEMFYNNSGFLNNDLGQLFKGLIVYMEHRYFGESMPFGTEKESFKKENLVYLTSLQALTDFANFLQYLKSDVYKCPTCPVIAVGGSYGGMLASWMRIKFPNVIQGALACSAPIVYFWNRQGLNLESFFNITTKNYENNNCSKKIREGYKRLQYYEDHGSIKLYDTLNRAFNLCSDKHVTNKTGVSLIGNWLDNAFTYMAMTNYPYETDFLKKLPAWPANSSCEPFANVNLNDDDEKIFTALRKAAMYYYNYSSPDQCNDIFSDSSSDEDMSGWNILACGDMVMPMESNGVDDMFRPMKWNTQAYSDQCFEQFGLRPNLNWTLDFYGGRVDSEFRYDSNIFFSNGRLDPWSGGGVYYKNDWDIDYVLMSMSAHHLDLRSPNVADPVYVVEGRKQEIKIIEKWLGQKADYQQEQIQE